VPIKDFSALKELASSREEVTVVIAGGHDSEALKAADMAVKDNIAHIILVADKEKLEKTASEEHIDTAQFEVVYADSEEEMARKAVQIVRDGGAHAIMKGLVKTATFLKAVLNKEWGIRRAKLLSHVALFEVLTYTYL